MSTSPRVITVGNVKGGVGKSTTAVQVALHAAARGHRVLLVDADPGRSALSWATRAGDEWPSELAVVAHPFPDLARRLRSLSQGFTTVVIDTPHSPTDGLEVGLLLAVGLAVADEVIIPTAPLRMDIDRLGDMLAAVEAEALRRDLSWHLVLTKVDLRSRAHVEITAGSADRGLPVYRSIVPLRSAVARAFGTATVLREYAALAAEVLTSPRAQVVT